MTSRIAVTQFDRLERLHLGGKHSQSSHGRSDGHQKLLNSSYEYTDYSSGSDVKVRSTVGKDYDVEELSPGVFNVTLKEGARPASSSARLPSGYKRGHDADSDEIPGKSWITNEKLKEVKDAKKAAKEAQGKPAEEMKAGEYTKHTNALSASLTSTEIDDLNDYAADGHDFLNSELRGGRSLGDRHKAMTKSIDSAFQKSTPLDRDTTLYRGGKLMGRTFVDNGYVSTSISRKTASEHSEGTIYRIKVPKGTKVVTMGSKLSTNSHEKEVILPRKSKFRTVGDPTWSDSLEADVWDIELIP